MAKKYRYSEDSFWDSCGLVDVRGKINKQLSYVFANSVFYRKKFQEAGIGGKDTDLSMIPFTAKEELLKDQEEFPPFGSNLCVNTSKVRRIHRTSGTVKKPLLLALTENDILATMKAGTKCVKTAGLTENDIVVHCLNYCMWMGGYTDHQILENAGATVIPFGVGNSRHLIETIRNLNVTGISATPSYLGKLELLLNEEFDILPRELGLRIGLLGTESGLQDLNFRKRLEEVWGIKAMNSNFGMADVLSIFGSECNERDGLHFISEGNLFVELVDPDTGKPVPIEKGAQGEMVLTNLHKEAQPLIRFRSRDMIEVLQDSACRCGLKSFKFKVVGRSDEMLVIKGLNVYPNQVRAVINQHLDILTGNFKIILESPPPHEVLYLKIEYGGKASLPEIEMVRFVLTKELKTSLFISPVIELVREGTIHRTEGKSSHISICPPNS